MGHSSPTSFFVDGIFYKLIGRFPLWHHLSIKEITLGFWFDSSPRGIGLVAALALRGEPYQRFRIFDFFALAVLMLERSAHNCSIQLYQEGQCLSW